MLKAVPLEKCYRLLNHGPTVLITTAHQGKINVMAAAWNMALDFSPPKVAVVVASDTYTKELIDKSNQFVINIPTREQMHLTMQVGSISGKELVEEGTNKFEELGISYQLGKLGIPLVDGCVGYLECKALREPSIESKYDLFIGEALAAQADDRAFENGHWKLPPKELQSIHHVSGGVFFVASELISDKK